MKIKEMTDKEFYDYQVRASIVSFSPFALYCQELKGKELFLRGERLDRWEAYAISKDSEKILKGLTKIDVV